MDQYEECEPDAAMRNNSLSLLCKVPLELLLESPHHLHFVAALISCFQAEHNVP